MRFKLFAGAALLSLSCSTQEQDSPSLPPSFSGIYPHLAMYNSQGEAGTGAVVPWDDRLWVVT